MRMGMKASTRVGVALLGVSVDRDLLYAQTECPVRPALLGAQTQRTNTERAGTTKKVKSETPDRKGFGLYGLFT